MKYRNDFFLIHHIFAFPISCRIFFMFLEIELFAPMAGGPGVLQGPQSRK
jgi:hypothetical protein